MPKPSRIVVVSNSSVNRQVLDQLGDTVDHIDESCVPDFFPRHEMPALKWKTFDRSGWYFQQLLKWALRKCSHTADYVVIDSDTILCRTFEARRHGKYVFRRSAEHHEDYFRTFEKLLGYYPRKQQSFIVNYMIFNVTLVNEIIETIEARMPAQKWHQIILEAINPQAQSSFSEFETYGHYLSRFHPECFESESESNLILPSTTLRISWFDRLLAQLRGYNSISYHNYI